MAKYRIQSPDGGTYEITAPDDASESDVLAYAQQQFAPKQQSMADRYRAAGINPKSSPTKGMGTGQRLAAGFGKAFSDAGAGLKQAALKNAALPFDALNAASGALGIGGPGVRLNNQIGDFLNAQVAGQQAQIDEQKRLDAPLRGTAGGKVGEAAGYLTQLLGPGLLARASAAAPMLLPSSIRGMAAQGAVVGGLQPVASDDSRMGNIAMGGAGGAVGGAIAPVAGAVARPVYRGLTAPLRPLTQGGQEEVARRVLMGSASDPARLLQPAPSAIPGVSRTLAEESLDPGIASLQRTVQQRTGAGNEYEVVRGANNDARVRAIQQFAGDEASLRAAQQARTTSTNRLLRQAKAGQPAIDIGPVNELLAAAIEKNAARPPVQSALRDVAGSLAAGADDLESRYMTRKYIGDLLEGKAGADKSYAKAATRELVQVKGALDQQLRAASPEFGDYLDSYIAMSRPVNRMQVGQTLLKDAQGSIVDPITHQYRITPAAFGRQVRNLDRAAQKATGFKKAKAEDALQPADMATISAIEDDLSRQAFADSAARQGSDTFQKLMSEGNILGAMDELGVSIPGGAVLKMLGNRGRERVNATLAEVLANPARARQILAKAPATDRRVIQQYLSAAGGRLGIIGAAESE